MNTADTISEVAELLPAGAHPTGFIAPNDDGDGIPYMKTWPDDEDQIRDYLHEVANFLFRDPMTTR